MKYAVVLCDGMADYPVPALGGKTPMMVADKPHIDALAQKAQVGLVRTVAQGLKPGSDVANMSVLGFDPKKYHKGRSPLEAANLGVQMAADDVALRCNLVTLSDAPNYEDKTMVDYSAGDISTEEAHEIIAAVREHFANEKYDFYAGVSYRHCLMVHHGTMDLGKMTPPHDISGRVIGEYLSDSENAAPLIAMMRESCELLRDHPVNKARIAAGKRPANAIWFWGEGTCTALPSFEDLYGLKGTIISAVDLLGGIGFLAGMHTPKVPGATGYIDTNFKGKAETAVAEWQSGQDLVYLHFEAPDECGHRNEPENKVRSIELIDSIVLPILLDYLEKQGDYKVLLLPDHPTPIVTMTHASDPVPYLMFSSSNPQPGVDTLNEETAKTGVFVENGTGLMRQFIDF
jgi:2,3-bisphosphoglycerate-independent phosphoglycerate mutase